VKANLRQHEQFLTTSPRTNIRKVLKVYWPLNRYQYSLPVTVKEKGNSKKKETPVNKATHLTTLRFLASILVCDILS